MSKSNPGFVPFDNMVLLLRQEVETMSEGGVHIPEEAQEKDRPFSGEVIAIGPDVSNMKTGDVVVYNKYGGSPIELQGSEYIIIRADEVQGRLKTPEQMALTE